jgi:predicted unusual protein kinase regulating ubiquinone biosynthesis (AarF/ABC1/UbiB family)
LHDETDYLLEGRQLARFGALLAGDADFVVPERHEDWTTPQILSMGYVEGRPIEEAAEASQAERDRISARLIDFMLREVFAFGLMQTDPNFANYRFDPATGRVILLDFRGHAGDFAGDRGPVSPVDESRAGGGWGGSGRRE